MIFNPVVPMPKKIETIQARDIAVGSSVYLNENGNYVEYLVVNQGIPSNSNLYDSSCNGTWLLRKDIHSKRVCDTSNVNIYETSEINTWLNSDFFNSLGAVEQTTIKQVKIPYRKNGGPSGTDQSGANGLSCKIFLLSGCEVGGTTSDNQYLPADGAKLDYFESGTGTSANNKRIANYNGTAAYWWLRSPYTDDASYMWHVRTDGDYGIGSVIGLEGVRPALILPFNAEFDNTNMRLVGTTYPTNFADATWAQIIAACQNNTVPDTWVIGNQKTMTIDGADYAIDIIGKNHDTYSDGSGTAPLTFQLHDCYVKQTFINSHNSGGWTSCTMRQTHLPAILSKMPTEVQNGIREVNKLTSAGNQSATINTTADKLFLLSEIEIFGSITYSFSGEGSQYPYFTTESNRIKYFADSPDVAAKWWERSPDAGNFRNFCMVYISGVSGNDDMANNRAVCFGFCF